MQKAQEIAKTSPTAWIIGGVVAFAGTAGLTRFATHFFKTLRPYQTTVGLPVAALLSTPFFVQALRVRSALQNASPTNSNPTSETSPPTTRRTSGPSPAGNSSPGEQSSDTRTPQSTTQRPQTNSLPTQQIPAEIQTLLQDNDLINKDSLSAKLVGKSVQDGLQIIFKHAIATKTNTSFLQKVFDAGFSPTPDYLRAYLINAVSDRNTDLTTLLLDRGASIDGKTRADESLFHLTAESGNVAMLSLLLQRQPDADAWDYPANNNKQLTPLHLAILGGHRDAVTLLLENGADPNKRTGDGLSAFYLAAYHQQEEIAKAVINTGCCTINSPWADGKMGAQTNGLECLIEIIDEKHIDEESTRKILSIAIEAGANVNQHLSYSTKREGLCDYPPLATAIDLRNPVLVRILRQHGAQLDEKTILYGNSYSDSLAIVLEPPEEQPSAEDKEMIKCLLELGAKVTKETAEHPWVKAVQAEMSTETNPEVTQQ